jgi:hypothetical protein
MLDDATVTALRAQRRLAGERARACDVELSSKAHVLRVIRKGRSRGGLTRVRQAASCACATSSFSGESRCTTSATTSPPTSSKPASRSERSASVSAMRMPRRRSASMRTRSRRPTSAQRTSSATSSRRRSRVLRIAAVLRISADAERTERRLWARPSGRRQCRYGAAAREKCCIRAVDLFAAARPLAPDEDDRVHWARSRWWRVATRSCNATSSARARSAAHANGSVARRHPAARCLR